jgi:hypothetical protein
MFEYLTEEDWESEEANIFAALTLAPASALTLFAIARTFAVDPVDHITIWYYIFRFPGAWLHHRR